MAHVTLKPAPGIGPEALAQARAQLRTAIDEFKSASRHCHQPGMTDRGLARAILRACAVKRLFPDEDAGFHETIEGCAGVAAEEYLDELTADG